MNHTDRLTDLGQRRILALSEAQAIELALYAAILDAHAGGVPIAEIGVLAQLPESTVYAIVQRNRAGEGVGNT